MAGWSWLRHATIVTRLVLAVTGAMALVLALAGAFVFWRVQHGLDVQLGQDLSAYRAVVERSEATGTTPPTGSTGEFYEVYDARGQLVAQSSPAPTQRLLGHAGLRHAMDGQAVQQDVGELLPPGTSYRVQAARTTSPDGPVVVVAALSRADRDETLRELLVQLGVTDGLALIAASFVGYRTVRGALGPVERYQRAAAAAGEHGDSRLPVPADRDDELTRLGHTLNGLLARIEAATARERQLVADASHELRTPLSLLRAEVDYALHRSRSAAQLESVLRSVGKEVDRLTALANGLLDLEQLALGEGVQRDPVNVSTMIATVAARFAGALSATGRTLTVRAEDITARLDPQWMELAVGNLIDNAQRHGAGTVTVDAQRVADRLQIWVEDEGPGFAPEFVAQAFDRFARAEESRSAGGSGLGLALVAAVAAAHEGSASVDGSAGQSRVVIDVPV